MINTDVIHSSNILCNWNVDTFANLDSVTDEQDKLKHIPSGMSYAYHQLKDMGSNPLIAEPIVSTHVFNKVSEWPSLSEMRTDKLVMYLDSFRTAWLESAWGIVETEKSGRLNNTAPEFESFFSILPTDSLINKFRLANDRPWAGKLRDRLKALYESSVEDAPRQAPLTPESLRGFLKFIDCKPSVMYPSVVFTPDGLIRARWKKSNSEQLTLTFINHNDIDYMLFYPNEKHKGKVLISSGTSTADMLDVVLGPFDLSGLVFESLAEAV